MEQTASGKSLNPWKISAIVLGIALVAVVAIGGKDIFTKKDANFKQINSADGSDRLMKFLGEVYSDKLEATMNGLSEESGLYKVSVHVKEKPGGQESDGFVYMTRDGIFFIPQPINIDQTLTEFRKFKAQSGAGAEAGAFGNTQENISPSAPPPSGSPDTTIPAPVQE